MGYVNDTGLPSVTDILEPYNEGLRWFTDEDRRRGSRVHGACHAHLRGKWVVPLPPEYQGYFDSFRRWADDMIRDVILIEQRLIDIKRGYCGQPDLIARLNGDSGVSLVDWKTSNAAQRLWRYQVAAYWHLAGIQGIELSRGMTVRLRKDGGRALINEYTNTHRQDLITFFGALVAHQGGMVASKN